MAASDTPSPGSPDLNSDMEEFPDTLTNPVHTEQNASASPSGHDTQEVEPLLAATKKPRGRPPKNKGGKALAAAADPIPTPVVPPKRLFKKIILNIPCGRGAENTSQRVPIEAISTIEEVLDSIHQTMACTTVKVKPELTYKLSTATKNSQSFALKSEQDWELLVEEVGAAEKKKKEAVPVTINTSTQYMRSLRATLSKSKGNGSKTSSDKKRKKEELRILNLDADSEGSDREYVEEDGSDLPEKEQHWMNVLQRELSSCMRCGPQKLCKIDKAGAHITPTFQQLRGWVVALASASHGVTTKIPPKTTHFQSFHKSILIAKPVEDPSNAAPTPALESQPQVSQYNPGPSPGPSQWPSQYPYAPMPYPMHQPPYMGHGYDPYLSYRPAAPSSSPVSHLYSKSGSRTRTQLPSSDPPEYEENPYPSIDAFLGRFMITAPQRCLHDPAVQDRFTTQDFYHVNELRDFSSEQMQQMFSLTAGNAQFLLEEVKRAMKLVDKSHQKKRARME